MTLMGEVTSLAFLLVLSFPLPIFYTSLAFGLYYFTSFRAQLLRRAVILLDIGQA